LGSASFAAAATVTLLDDDVVHATAHPWDHTGLMSAYDCASLRRGFQVYRQVCASCHSLKGIHYRELVGVTHTDEELMAMAEEVDFVDGPNDEGEMFERPGKLTDHLPSPYPNDETGRMANGGALPPDLTLMVKSRHAGSDYLFSLLTGYCDPPSGKSVMAGLYYNPYFPGGAIAMPPPLSDGGVEYEDGTVATISQQAKDVSQFLHWASEPEADVRKKQAFQYLTALAFMTVVSGYYKRFKWSPLKTRQITYLQPNDPLMKLQKKKLVA
jgi:ubiquinol-cytochrome c reductase cytochrome c1 subunit